ncbi:MAG: hypothetical protein ACOX9C_06645 [Kiritimatiellia bacterium]|jgi:hypothetical protein
MPRRLFVMPSDVQFREIVEGFDSAEEEVDAAGGGRGGDAASLQW